jgi:Protein of unknown function (DUF3060)
MRTMRALATLACAVCLSACGASTRAPTATLQDGWVTYADSRVAQRIACDDRPVLLTGNRNELHLVGDCRQVRIAGEHNDISVNVAPGGTVEITGSHNDVNWTYARPGGRPQLLDHGKENSFHFEES